MDEVVVSDEEGMEMEVDQETEKKENSSSSTTTVMGVGMGRWEEFLPRMVLTVLLVEADDSTRQIIAALLRKCCYRVAAVPDGLRAWETLRARPHNIDLILTEVELPSISGYALLTLIMEHDICKSIPVIMMSSQDSISVVLKCMLKGAADFLIKPVRRNELRNLWQHVWRRRTQTAGHLPQDTTAVQQRVETTSGNNSASNHSSEYMASIRKSKECSEKGSDDQGMLLMKCGSGSNMSKIGRCEEHVKSFKNSVVHKSETGGKSIKCGPEVASWNEAYDSTGFSFEEEHPCAETMTIEAGVWSESRVENDNVTGQTHCCGDELVEPSGEAIDLIRKFENSPADINGHPRTNDGTEKFCVAPHLELSLRRSYTSCSKEGGLDEQHMLNHSNASAFFRRYSKAVQPLFPTLVHNCAESNADATTYKPCHGAALSNSQEIMINRSGQTEAAFPGSQLGFLPVTGLTYDGFCGGYGLIFPPLFYTQSGFPSVWSLKSSSLLEQSTLPVSSSLHSNLEIHDLEQGEPFGETNIHSADQTVQEDNFGTEAVFKHGSPAAILSPNSGFCNGVPSKLNSIVFSGICNSVDGNATTAAAIARATASESVNDNHLLVHDDLREMDSYCLTQREAALLKFQLKRKARCYEKKVRYQSRKRLAEQRLRVKGQFVRQLQKEPVPADADDGP